MMLLHGVLNDPLERFVDGLRFFERSKFARVVFSTEYPGKVCVELRSAGVSVPPDWVEQGVDGFAGRPYGWGRDGAQGSRPVFGLVVTADVVAAAVAFPEGLAR
jgi:hypothetical protein